MSRPRGVRIGEAYPAREMMSAKPSIRSQLEHSYGAPGHGLIGMSERTEAMGGTLRLEDTDGGVRIRVTLPDTRGRCAA